MSLHTRRPYLAAYDISDPKRLGRVHRYLKKVGVPLQYSVFLLYMAPARLTRVTTGLSRLIDPRADDVRIYPLPQRPDWQWWGRSMLMDGVTLLGIPLPDGLGGAKFNSGQAQRKRQ